MSLPAKLLFREPASGRRIGVVGDAYRLLATAEDTAGEYALIEATVPPGGGPPPHIHRREQEAFYVLEGQITFRVGEETLVGKPGCFANIPIGTPHSFKNESDQPARMLILLAPAGLEQMFCEVGVPLADDELAPPLPTPDDIARLVAAAPKYGVELLLPPH